MKFEFTAQTASKPARTKTPKYLGEIITYNHVKVGDKEYEIADKSKSINGLSTYYNTFNDNLIIQSGKFRGENRSCRPYKVGNMVEGRLDSENKFVISKIKKR